MKLLRSNLKNLVRSIVAASAPIAWRLAKQERLVILMYHRVLPMNAAARRFEQRGMMISPENLEMHIGVLKRHFDLVHLDDWVRDVRSGRKLPRRACALTFDDGWLDNYRYAFPLLKSTGAPATIYLVSNLVGGTYSFWTTRVARLLCDAWNSGDERAIATLQNACPTVNIPETVAKGKEDVAADRVIKDLKASYDDAAMQKIASDIDAGLGERELVDWNEVRTMSASGLVRFGSHTCTHTRMTAGIDQHRMRHEIEQSAADLNEKLGVPVAGFCYPNGDHTPNAVRMVGQKYDYAVTTKFGWNTSRTNPVLLRRVGIHDDVSSSPGRFMARLAMGL